MSNHSSRTPRTARRRNATKIAASVALVAGAAAVAGLGTFGSFTSSTNASESVSSGTVKIGLTQHAAQGTNIPVLAMVPGDTAQRAVVLTRDNGTEKFGSVMLTTSATTPAGSSGILTSDTTNGLQMTIDQCSVAWVKPANTKELLCTGGTVTQVVAPRPVIGGAVDMAAATTTLNGSGAASNLRITLTLPTEAGNAFQGQASTLNFVFDATQRTAEAR